MKKTIIFLAIIVTAIVSIAQLSNSNSSKKVEAYAITVDHINVPSSGVLKVSVDGEPYSITRTFSPGQTSCSFNTEGGHVLDIYSCSGSNTGSRSSFSVVSDTSLTITLSSGSCPF